MTSQFKKNHRPLLYKKEEQMLSNASSSGTSWAHIIKLQGGYFGKNRI